jgi:hypothetical protein
MSSLAGQIAQARHGGEWDQAGIASSDARMNALHNTGLAAIEGAEFITASGTTSFGGVAIDTSSVLVRYTYYGDTDLNGVVNFDDYARVDSGFNNKRSGWLNGDLDYNGTVNFDDYALIDLAFNTQGAPLRSTVPEPAMGLFACGLIGALTHVRRMARCGRAEQ